MLQTIHDKVTGWLAGIVLGAIAIVFVFWGINVREGASVATYAAKVNGEKIPLETARRAWQEKSTELQRTLRQELPPEFMKIQQQAVLDNLINERMLAGHVRDSGYRVTDATIAQTIMGFAQLQADGKFSRNIYTMALREKGMSEAQYEQELRSQLEISQLQSGIVGSTFATATEIKRALALQNEKRELDYAVIPLASFKDSVAVTEAQIQSWYDAHKTDYMTAETADFQYLQLTLDDVAKEIKTSDEDLKSFYEQNKERYETLERRHVHHILISVGEGVDDAAARKTAETVLAKAKAGEDFAALAKQYSKDLGSAQQGGDLEWRTRGASVGAFDDAVFSMAAGEIRGPVKTEFGYHIIKVDEIDKARNKTFDEARPDLETEYRRERAQSAFYERSQKLADQSFSAQTELDSTAKALGLQIRQVTGFTRQGTGTGGEVFAGNSEIVNAVFSEEVLEKRHNSPMVGVGDDTAVVLRVTNHHAPEQKPLADVRADITTQLKTQAERAAAAAKGSEALQQLEKGTVWSAVVAGLKIQPVGKKFVGRREAEVAAPALRLAFGIPRASINEAKPVYRGTVLDNGDYALVAVSGVRSGDDATQGKAAAESVARQASMAELAGYMKQLESKAKIQRNPSVFE